MVSLSEVQTLPWGFLPRLGPRQHLSQGGGRNPSGGRPRSPNPTATGQGLGFSLKSWDLAVDPTLADNTGPCRFVQTEVSPVYFRSDPQGPQVASRVRTTNSVYQKRKLRPGAAGSLGVASRAGRGLSSGSAACWLRDLEEAAPG